MLFLNRRRAINAALHAIRYEGRADRFMIQQRRERQADRSCEQGYAVLLFKRGRFVGCVNPAKAG